ncbi:glycosyl hydrolase 115 family protein [Abyssalbus ytuae]|uniref:Glycosyl hydrolase 115 family protein n=1 Tax=Abyssalbus ytuae TaxID=2926907 RepID=A0A9E6ZN66_9FLAO|nr:glycosyl hydrolase 115 family protein [Abyssalbus ytuae]UOB17779.1 glycosyl hydrolase 115 family protein [Abyssalbus ytuae]
MSSLKLKKLIYTFFVPVLLCGCLNTFIITNKSSGVNIYVDAESDKLIKWAANDLAEDLEYISGKKITINYIDHFNNKLKGIFIGKFDNKLIQSCPVNLENKLEKQWEKFVIVEKDNNLYISGSDIRGTVYAIFEIAEKTGISPWKWWADVKPEKSERIAFKIPQEGIERNPSVKYRGIFINDEDWGLQPWAAKTFEPEINDIGPKTYEKVFQLLLRLKANTLWPAMHSCTKGFFNIPGNKEIAQKYHIMIGTSHAEPMLRNNVDEWDREKYGEYNYFSNQEKVKHYWQERISEIKDGEYMITLGMRGIHDSGMEGNASQKEKIKMLDTIFKDQREILTSTLKQPLSHIPQLFIPYKEVLELYNEGLNVPDDITLMWTDDNYGYIRRLSNDSEQQRKGGVGIYYHLSYWGRPHDYLWLSTTQPGLIWYEISRAYQNGAKKIWIVNVGDIKPAEYNIEFFLDLGWNINHTDENCIKKHLFNYCTRDFGIEKAQEIADILNEYYRLAFLRKPEFMGWSRTEPTTLTQLSQFASSDNDELQRRIYAYTKLYEQVESIKEYIPKEKKDAYFQLIEYPVKCAALMNFKFLWTDLSVLSEDKNEKEKFIQKAKQSYKEIEELTHSYNNEISEGKWKGIMSMAPRQLPVFYIPDGHLYNVLSNSDKEILAVNSKLRAIQANEYKVAKGMEHFNWKVINGLGYSNSAVTLFPFKSHLFTEEKPFLEYEFQIDSPGNYILEIRCLPTHSNNFDFKIDVSVNNEAPKTYDINTIGRSETWKENVLRNSTVISHKVLFSKSGKQKLRVYANQTGIVLDQIAIVPEKYNFYEIPDH